MVDQEAGKVPVVDCVSAAYRFSFANWTSFLPACVVLAAAVAFAAVAQTLYASNTLILTLAMFLQLCANMVLAGAVLRKALRPGEPGPAIAFGPDERRLLGVTLAIMLMFVPPAAIIAVVFLTSILGRLAVTPDQLEALMRDPEAFADAIAAALGPAGQMAFSIFVLLVTAIAIWIAIRLSLVNAATIGERRMVVLQTWSWTHGNLFRVFAAMALTILPVSIVSTIISAIVAAPLEGRTLQDIGVVTAVVIGALQGFVAGLLNIPPLALTAELYKGLRPPGFTPK